MERKVLLLADSTISFLTHMLKSYMEDGITSDELVEVYALHSAIAAAPPLNDLLALGRSRLEPTPAGFTLISDPNE